MAEAFKNLINADTVTHAGEHLLRAWPGLDRARFEQVAKRGLEALEFKDRAMQVASALEACLPDAFDQAAAVLEGSLAPPLRFDAAGEPIGLAEVDPTQGVRGWMIWGYGEFVVRRGMGDVPRALTCLHALTQRFTAEYAVRPFIATHPQVTWPALELWAKDGSAHVRRLASEGSRPRLPWGIRLQALVNDPSPSWPLLSALQDDPSAYVRRSVANHLNDIAKDHPDAVAGWVAQHLKGAGAQRTSLLRHASRGLIKQGHANTLAAWGLGQGFKGESVLTLSSDRATVGDSLGLHVSLRSTSQQAQTLVVDYAVHYVRANGSTSPKVFKGWTLTLAPGETRALKKSHSLKPVTTRTLYPGRHAIDLLVNGSAVAHAEFVLRLSDNE